MFGLFDASEKQIANAFELGRKAGYEEGIQDGMAKNFERSEELTKAEYDEVIRFLVARGLELCCYDFMQGGFRVRKRKQ